MSDQNRFRYCGNAIHAAAFALVLICLGAGWHAIGQPKGDDETAQEALPYNRSQRVDITVRPGNLVDTVVTYDVIPGNAAAAKDVSEQSLDVNEHFSSLQIIEAATFKADGRRIDVPAESITTQIKPTKITEADHFLIDEKMTTIQFPDVAAGDRVHLVAKWSEKASWTEGLVDGAYAVDAAANYSSFVITLDTPVELKLQTAEKTFEHKVSEKGSRVVHEWSIGALPYQPTEAEAVSALDRGAYVLFSSFADWDEAGRAYSSNADKMAAVTPEITKLAEQITAGRSGTRDQAEAIFDWVIANIRYVNIVLGTGGFVPRPASYIAAQRYGDCKDHSTLMRALLAAKGIKSESVLVNSGRAIFKPFSVPISSFDHAILYIPELDLYADPTADDSALSALPTHLYDKPVLRTGNGRSTFTRIPPLSSEANAVTSHVELTVADDGKTSAKAKLTATGGAIWQLTNEITRTQSIGDNALMAEKIRALGLQGNGRIESKSVNRQAASATMQIAAELDRPLIGEDNSGFPIASLSFIEVPFRKYGAVFRSDRTRDFVCIPTSHRATIIYHLPAGWRPEALPADISRTGGNAEFSARYLWSGNTLTIERAFAFRGWGSVCPAAAAIEMAPVFNAAMRDNDQTLTFVRTDTPGQPSAQSPATGLPSTQDEAEQHYVQSRITYAKVLPGNLLELTMTNDILIKTAEGVDQKSTQALPVADEFTDYEITEAATLKADGRRIDVTADKIVERSFGRAYVVRTIIFPDLAPGDRIRYSVRGREKSRRAPWDGFSISFSRSWFNWDQTGKTSLDVPSELKLRIANNGFRQKTRQDGDRTIYEWEPEPLQIKPVVSELMVFEDVQMVQVSSYADWSQLGDAYCRPAEAVSSVTPVVAALAEQIVSGHEGRLKEARAIYDWLLAHISDNDLSFDKAGWVPNAPATTLQTRRGNGNDMAALLRALLAARGIESHFALVTGADFALPVASFYKTVLYVPEFDLYTDPTVAFSSFGTLDERRYGTQVLRCGPGGSGISRIPQARAEANMAEFRAEVTVGADGKASGTSTLSATGVNATALRKFRFDADKAGSASVLRERLNEAGLRGSARIVDAAPATAEAAAMKMAFSIDQPLLGEDEAQEILVGPRILSRPFLSFERGLRRGRAEPFFCLPQTYREMIVYRLPKGWKPKALPKDVERSADGGAFTARYKSVGDSIEVERTFTVSAQNSTCPGPMADAFIPVAKAAVRDSKERLTIIPTSIAEHER